MKVVIDFWDALLQMRDPKREAEKLARAERKSARGQSLSGSITASASNVQTQVRS